MRNLMKLTEEEIEHIRLGPPNEDLNNPYDTLIEGYNQSILQEFESYPRAERIPADELYWFWKILI